MGATGIGVSAISGSAAGEKNPVVELNGVRAKRLIATARRSQSLRDLYRAVVRDGKYVRPLDVTAYEITPMGAEDATSFEAVMFEYSIRGESENLEIGVPIGDSATIPAKATLTRKNDDQFPVEMTEYVSADTVEPTGMSENSDVATVSTTQTTVAGEQNMVQKREYDLSELYADVTEDSGVGTQDHSKCETGEHLPCWGCKDIVSAVNALSCTTHTYIICGALSIPSGGMGGFACVAVVGLVCWALHHYALNNPSYICKKLCSCH